MGVEAFLSDLCRPEIFTSMHEIIAHIRSSTALA